MISSGLLLAGRRLAVTFGEIQRESESDTDFIISGKKYALMTSSGTEWPSCTA